MFISILNENKLEQGLVWLKIHVSLLNIVSGIYALVSVPKTKRKRRKKNKK